MASDRAERQGYRMRVGNGPWRDVEDDWPTLRQELAALDPPVTQEEKARLLGVGVDQTNTSAR